jgi:hypothetical protein
MNIGFSYTFEKNFNQCVKQSSFPHKVTKCHYRHWVTCQMSKNKRLLAVQKYTYPISMDADRGQLAILFSQLY